MEKNLRLLLAVGIAVLVYVFQRRGETIQELQQKALRDSLTKDLTKLQKKSKKSKEDADAAYKRYRDLLATYPEHAGTIRRYRPKIGKRV